MQAQGEARGGIVGPRAQIFIPDHVASINPTHHLVGEQELAELSHENATPRRGQQRGVALQRLCRAHSV